ASAPHATAIGVAAAAMAVQTLIDATLDHSIRQVLKECADKARSDVMYRHFQRSPTREERMEVVEHDSQGQPVTRAMLLGREQHQAALECAEQRLRQIKPGGFTLSPPLPLQLQHGRDPVHSPRSGAGTARSGPER